MVEKARAIEKTRTYSNIKGLQVSVFEQNKNDYISLTDIARYRNPKEIDHILQNWMRNHDTIEFLGIWEKINNPLFKPLEFEGFKIQAGLNSFSLTPKRWIEGTGAIGLISKSGRYRGGTFAHRDIFDNRAVGCSFKSGKPECRADQTRPGI